MRTDMDDTTIFSTIGDEDINALFELCLKEVPSIKQTILNTSDRDRETQKRCTDRYIAKLGTKEHIKEYHKKYYARPEVKARHKIYMREYNLKHRKSLPNNGKESLNI